jgi:hypothetical protein
MTQRSRRVPVLFFAIVLAAISASSPLLAERWKLQYFHDENDSSLSLIDMTFPSAKVGIACGVLTTKTDPKGDGVVLLTSDSGKTWQTIKVKEVPVSLYFLDDSIGYMVTQRGIWKTEERGLTWKKLKGTNGILRVHFIDSKRGFAVGFRKQMLSTVDGGLTWKPVEAAQTASSKPEHTVYHWIAFDGPDRAIVLGHYEPPRKNLLQVPEWADPEAAQRIRERPTLSITLETKDGGKTWNPQTAPIFGKLALLRFMPKGMYGLSIVQFDNAFKFPSELQLVNWRSGKSESVFAKPDRHIVDVGFLGPASGAILAAIERPGTMVNSPLPGKLKILKANNLRSWIEMPVDYRATGTDAILSVVDEKNAWVALDSGMILRLEP